MTIRLSRLALTFILVFTISIAGSSQRGSATLFGDVKIKENPSGAPPAHIVVILYREARGEIGRQNVANGSRYRFADLNEGSYELAIEIDYREVSRTRVTLQGLGNSPFGFQQDLAFEWRSTGPPVKTTSISAADVYDRPVANKSLFKKAEEAVGKKNYDRAIALLKQIVASDKMDSQAWTILGTLYAAAQEYVEAERAYLNALTARPTFSLALLDLGRLRLKQRKFAEAIEPLTRLVGLQPESGEANLLLGDAYVQTKLGSKAIPHLNAAANFGYPEAHLRLAWLYDAAGLKEKAVVEYEEFLKKRPDYPERQKLDEYIRSNRKN